MRTLMLSSPKGPPVRYRCRAEVIVELISGVEARVKTYRATKDNGSHYIVSEDELKRDYEEVTPDETKANT